MADPDVRPSEEPTVEIPRPDVNGERGGLSDQELSDWVNAEADQKELGQLERIVEALEGQVLDAEALLSDLAPADRERIEPILDEHRRVQDMKTDEDVDALTYARARRDVYQNLVKEIRRMQENNRNKQIAKSRLQPRPRSTDARAAAGPLPETELIDLRRVDVNQDDIDTEETAVDTSATVEEESSAEQEWEQYTTDIIKWAISAGAMDADSGGEWKWPNDKLREVLDLDQDGLFHLTQRIQSRYRDAAKTVESRKTA